MDELVSSKNCLEEKLGEQIQVFAYPHGHSHFRIQKMVEAAGYEAAFGMSRGRYHRFNLWRTQCQTGDTLLNFIFQLTKWPYYRRHFREETKVGQIIRSIKHRIS